MHTVQKAVCANYITGTCSGKYTILNVERKKQKFSWKSWSATEIREVWTWAYWKVNNWALSSKLFTFMWPKLTFVIFSVMHSSVLWTCCLQLDVFSLAKCSQWSISASLSRSLSVSSSCVSQGRAGVGGKTPQCHLLHTEKHRYLNKA